MSLARAAAIAVALVLAAGAVLYRHAYAHGGSKPLAWRDETAVFPRLEPPRLTSAAFAQRERLADYLRKAMPGEATRLPAFDFQHRRLVLAAAGPRSSTGYDVRIVRAVEQRRRMLVVARELAPRLGDPTDAQVTYPHRLISIPAGKKPAVVEWQGRP